MATFKCIICKIDIERSKKVFIKNKGQLLCSTCLDKHNKKFNLLNIKLLALI